MDWLKRLLGKSKPAAIQKRRDRTFQTAAANPGYAVKEAGSLDHSQEIHLLVLKRFLAGRSLSDPSSVPPHWEPLLRESTPNLLKRFVQDGWLVPVDLRDTVLTTTNATELKALLKERGLRVGGKKADLVDRLMEADPDSMARLYGAKKLYRCSDEVKARVKAYEEQKKRDFEEAAAAGLAAIRQRDFATASRIVATYEDKQLDVYTPNDMSIPPSPRDINHDIARAMEVFTFRPKILNGLSDVDWESMHHVTALSELFHGRLSTTWFPADFQGVKKFGTETAVRMMHFHITQRRNAAKMKAAGIKKATITCVNAGSCEACMAIDGKRFPIDRLPELPYEKCTCQLGCRCGYRAEFDFD